MPPNHFESEVESFLEGSHGDRTHIKRADHHTVTPLCGTLLWAPVWGRAGRVLYRGVCAAWLVSGGLRDKILPASLVSVSTGIIFSLLASNGLIWVFFAVWGEFCTGGRGQVLWSGVIVLCPSGWVMR